MPSFLTVWKVTLGLGQYHEKPEHFLVKDYDFIPETLRARLPHLAT